LEAEIKAKDTESANQKLFNKAFLTKFGKLEEIAESRRLEQDKMQ